jgi:hypothetical protein
VVSSFSGAWAFWAVPCAAFRQIAHPSPPFAVTEDLNASFSDRRPRKTCHSSLERSKLLPKRQVLERARTVATAHQREGSKQDEQHGEDALSYFRWVGRALAGLGQILANHRRQGTTCENRIVGPAITRTL